MVFSDRQAEHRDVGAKQLIKALAGSLDYFADHQTGSHIRMHFLLHQLLLGVFERFKRII
jgi:hypothetical protein